MNKSVLQTQPYKGARDFYPADMQIRNYIFDTWKRVCKKFGFEEYDFPILEPLELFAAKTGQEIVNDQLFSFKDRGGRDLVVRPELTPGTVRMLAQKYGELIRPVKWFMIGNNWRYEKPQTGRGREFYQLEANIFGVEGVLADFEIFQLIIAIMTEFGANEKQFEVRFSDRKLLNTLLLDILEFEPEMASKVRHLMDKYNKMGKEAFEKELGLIGISDDQINKISTFITADFSSLNKVIPQKTLDENIGYQNLKALLEMLEMMSLGKYCLFDPSIIRGFDYSDGIVYEVFDKNPNNRRSIFGGERFDQLINIFGNYDLPATGFALGDWTLKEFLTNWNFLPNNLTPAEYFVAIWPSQENNKCLKASLAVAEELRKKGKTVFIWLDQTSKLDKQLKAADKKQITYALIIGENELKDSTITVKDLKKMTQKTLPLDKFIGEIK